MSEIDPIALGKRVGNIVNGMPEYPTPEDVEVAVELARIGLIDALEFDERTNPEPFFGPIDD